MTIWLVAIIVLLGLLELVQFSARRKRTRQLRYIDGKLNGIMSSGSSERLLLLTDDKELQALLNTMNRLLDRHQQTIAHFNHTELAMRRMLSNISHDLKTPLTVILGYIEALQHQRNRSSEETDRILAKVHGKAEEIVALIHSFFDLARLESGDTELPMTRINLAEICKNNILMFYESVHSYGCEAHIDIPDHPVYIISNEEALNRILNNLLSNAIRYGRDGRHIGLTLRTDQQAVYVEVWDRGPGIGESQQDLVFERLYTLEDSRNKAFQGSGLGLTITKRLVEKLGGEISVRSKPYEQTIFTVKWKRTDIPGVKA